MSTKAEKQWMSDVADLGCVVCRNHGYGPTEAEVHHVKTGCGMSQRSSDLLTIPLCPQHHRLGGNGIAFHAGPKTWQERFGSEITLLNQTIKDMKQFRNSFVGRVA